MKKTTRPRSADTRARILAVAKRLFSQDGYESTTIRAVAAESAIDPSMVMRYFRTKERLFTAAASFDLRLPDLSRLPRSQSGEAIMRHFLDRWEGPTAGEELRILVRSAITHPAAAKRVIEVFENQAGPFIAGKCPRGRSAECAALVASQLLGLAYTRYILKLPAVAKLSQEVIVRRVGATIQGYLNGT